MQRIKVAILAATGAVGQRFVQLLDNHPWFEVAALTASDRSEGRPYAEACKWFLAEPMPAYAQAMTVRPTEPGACAGCGLAFSALPADNAKTVEPAFAQAGLAVCSNASTHRMWPDVPLLIPTVNPDHTALVETQQKQRGWPGFIVTNPNCTSTGLTTAFKALQSACGLKRAVVVSMQALSGAGYPGVSALDILDNVVPYIGGEEEKVETEPRKMLGQVQGGQIEFAPVQISAHTNRVAVLDGHTVCVSVELGQKISPAEAAQCLAAYQAPAVVRGLPSAPQHVIEVRTEPDRPQPRKDRNAGQGMTSVVGRLREDPLFHLKFVVLSHNTIAGAAGGAILNGELLAAQGLVK